MNRPQGVHFFLLPMRGPQRGWLKYKYLHCSYVPLNKNKFNSAGSTFQAFFLCLALLSHHL